MWELTQIKYWFLNIDLLNWPFHLWLNAFEGQRISRKAHQPKKPNWFNYRSISQEKAVSNKICRHIDLERNACSLHFLLPWLIPTVSIQLPAHQMVTSSQFEGGYKICVWVLGNSDNVWIRDVALLLLHEHSFLWLFNELIFMHPLLLVYGIFRTN